MYVSLPLGSGLSGQVYNINKLNLWFAYVQVVVLFVHAVGMKV